MSFRIDNYKLTAKYKTISTKTEVLQNIELNALSVYDDRYIKIKITVNTDKFYTKFHCLNMSEHGVECQSFMAISIGSLLPYGNKY